MEELPFSLSPDDHLIRVPHRLGRPQEAMSNEMEDVAEGV